MHSPFLNLEISIFKRLSLRHAKAKKGWGIFFIISYFFEKFNNMCPSCELRAQNSSHY